MSTWKHPLPGVPPIESPFFGEWLDQTGLDDETRRIATDLHRDGYAVFEFPDDRFDELADRAREDSVRVAEGTLVADESSATVPLVRELQHGKRVLNGWVVSEAVREIATNARILELLQTLYGRRPWPFQTLNFSSGTQQHYHSDSVHFSSIPERFMCGVWVAFEDMDENNGPLIYYPGSHRFPLYTNVHIEDWADKATDRDQDTYHDLWARLIELHGLEERQFHARRGQALLWAANLLHGGKKHLDPQRTRWSQVTHYYFANCAYYTPMYSDEAFGRTHFRDPIDVSTGQRVKHSYIGHEIPETVIQRATGRAALGGTLEDRLEHFNGELYLLANPDVKAAGTDPRQHYIRNGFREGRPLAPTET